MKKHIIKAIIKVILLTPVGAFGIVEIINFAALFFTGDWLPADASNVVVIVSCIASFALFSSVYYGDYTNGYWGNSNKESSRNESKGKSSGHVYVSSSSASVRKSDSPKQEYNGPKTLPMGCYEPFFDLDNDGKMNDYETYLQWENDRHMKDNTSNDFWN